MPPAVQCTYADGRAIVRMTYQYPGNKRQNHYTLCAQHASRFSTDPAIYRGSKPVNK
jgi:hypothetical protein